MQQDRFSETMQGGCTAYTQASNSLMVRREKMCTCVHKLMFVLKGVLLHCQLEHVRPGLLLCVHNSSHTWELGMVTDSAQGH